MCPPGQYMNPQQVCENLTPTCPVGSFPSAGGCASCPAGCSQCTSATSCTICRGDGFYATGGLCITRCGDGIRAGNEGCDDGNGNAGDGCSASCTVEPNFVCGGDRPTVCRATGLIVCGNGNIDAGEQCDDGNRNSGDGCFNCRVENGWTCDARGCRPNQPPADSSNLVLVGDVRFNFNNVFVVLKTPKPYPGLSELEKKSFMKYTFPAGAEPSSAYCNQKVNAFDTWECLIIYASGLPNRRYTVRFSYNYSGDSGFNNVLVDPFRSKFNTRSLK